MPQGVAEKKIELEKSRFKKKQNRKTKLSVVLYLGSLSILPFSVYPQKETRWP